MAKHLEWTYTVKIKRPSGEIKTVSGVKVIVIDRDGCLRLDFSHLFFAREWVSYEVS